MVGDFQNDPMWGGESIRVSFRLMTAMMVVVSTLMQYHIQLLNISSLERLKVTFNSML
jgi:hypothetical protein